MAEINDSKIHRRLDGIFRRLADLDAKVDANTKIIKTLDTREAWRSHCEFIEGLERRADVSTFEKKDSVQVDSSYRPRGKHRR